jgi:hypothetical protein
VWDRLAACGVKVRRENASVEQIYTDSADAGFKKGDLLVILWVDLPLYRGNDMGLSWIVRGGKGIPNSGWADRLQNSREIPEFRC